VWRGIVDWSLWLERKHGPGNTEALVASLMKRFLLDEQGATSIEYALIAGFIGLAIITSAQAIGSGLVTIFTNVAAGFPT